MRWETHLPGRKPPLSWHSINELDRLLEEVQEYLDSRPEGQQDSGTARNKLLLPPFLNSSYKKRKTPDSDTNLEKRPLPVDRRLYDDRSTLSVVSRSSSGTSLGTQIPVRTTAKKTSTRDVFNGVLEQDDDGFYYGKAVSFS